MPFSKISTKHQVTIPQEVFHELGLRVGDHVEVSAAKGRIVLTPQQMVARPPIATLTPEEQELLPIVRAKVSAIQEDPINSTGLTPEEADLAAKVGLIARDQRWWWLEDWQKGEREAEQDDREGRYTEYETPEAFLESLNSPSS